MTMVLRAAAAALCLASPAAAGPVTTIALSDRAAPGSTTGPSGDIQFGGVQLNEAGQVLYLAYPGPPGKRTAVLERYTPGVGVERLATSGDAAPGVPGRLIRLSATTAGMRLQQDGDATFYAQLNVPAFNQPSLNAFYEATGTGAGLAVAPVAVESSFQDSPLVDTLDDGHPASPWIGIQDIPEVSESGQLLDVPVGAFGLGGLNPRPLGVWQSRTFTTLLAPGDVLRDGDGLPLKTFAGADLTVAAIAEGPEQINADGTIVAQVTTNDASRGRALLRLAPGEPVEVLGVGRPGDIGAFDVNDAGEVAWTQGVDTDGDSFADAFRLRRTEGAALVETPIARRAVGTPIDLTEAGSVLLAGGRTFEIDGQVFAASDDYRLFTIGGFRMNAGGDVAFNYTGQLFADPGNLLRSGIGLLRSGAFEFLLEVGDFLEVAPGDTRQISQLFVSDFARVRRTDSPFFNDAGQIAFDAIFEPVTPGGPVTSGVFLYDTGMPPAPVPLPAGEWLLLTGLGALALRRRISG